MFYSIGEVRLALKWIPALRIVSLPFPALHRYTPVDPIPRCIELILEEHCAQRDSVLGVAFESVIFRRVT